MALRDLTIGFLINPVAGVGGPAGLKGSDGRGIQQEALTRGVRPRAEQQAVRMLEELGNLMPADFTLLTAPGLMGQSASLSAGLFPHLIKTDFGQPGLFSSTARNTKEAVRRFCAHGVDIIIFVGGDGTARDVYEAMAGNLSRTVVLGVPSGVKMQSGVFARSAVDAAVIVRDWRRGKHRSKLAEVADIDENARRHGILASSLYGYMNVPDTGRKLQGGKIGSSVGGQSVAGMAAECARSIDPDAMCLLAPGSTVLEVAKLFNGTPSLLGVDVLHRGRIIAEDQSAAELHAITLGQKIQMVVSPIGGQGFLFGRGNQQLDAQLLSRLRREDLLIVCTDEKLAQLGGGPLYIDVAEAKTLDILAGYHRVITGTQHMASVRVDDVTKLRK